MILRERGIAPEHVLLNDDAAAYGFDGAVKDRNEPVAGRFDEPTLMLDNAGLDKVALDALHAHMRAFFIDFHQSAIADDITRDDRGETARQQRARHGRYPDTRASHTSFCSHPI